MSPLDHKLLRDLWRMKGQGAAIGAVIGVGVMLMVMMTGLTVSLTETRAAYYDRYRLADVFASVARAPDRMADRVALLPGVAAVESRIVGRALIEVPGEALGIQAQAVSLPERGWPALNDIYLTDGRMLEGGRSDDVIVLESFAKAHDLSPGDSLRATMNGARRTFRILGLAQSPEFLYTTAPGEMVPDDARFGVIWMSRSSLAATYDLDGAFNDLLIGLTRDARQDAVIAAVDDLLDPFGGRGAYGREDQQSNRFVSEEISGLEAAAKGVPPIFLAVAAFLLYIVMSRMVQSEREEIGLMKAFGYTNAEVGAHYFKMILAIAAGGALAGCLAGIVAGRMMIGMYLIYFKFPFLVFQLDPSSFVIGVSASILAASAGGLFVLRRVFALDPATAMRPPAPANYVRAGQMGRALARRLDQPSRMVLRRILRQPVRMAGAMIGIATGMALSVSMITIYAGFDRTIDLTFSVVDRSDATVSFTHPVSDKTLFELGRLPGVTHVEGMRHAAVVFENGRNSYRGVLTGLPPDPRLNRALDADMAPIPLPERGVVLSFYIAQTLGLRPGDLVRIDLREGRQPALEVPVAGIAQTLLGSPAYMDLSALNALLGEPGRVTSAALTLDPARADAVYAELRDMPTVVGVSVKAQAHDAFVEIMDTGAGSVRYVMGAMAFIITFGIVYNAARIAFAERERDLASLRVIGFTSGEAAFVLLGELAVVVFVALPLGGVLGYYLSFAIAAGFSTELYQIPALFDPVSYGSAMLVVLGAAFVSGGLVVRDLNRSDLVEALKRRE